MFRSKPLIATPRDRKENHFEFTPLGGENHLRGDTSTAKKNDLIYELINKKRNPLNNSPLVNRLNGGSSFIEESTYDTIQHAETNQRHKTSSPIPNELKSKDLLTNGSNPVRQQQEDISNLKSENYNLKVKIASLTKYLNAISSQDQQYIYEENSKLQEQVIVLRSEVSQLNKELSSKSAAITADPRVKLLEHELNQEKLAMRKLCDEHNKKSQNVTDLERDYDRLEADFTNLQEELHELAKENERAHIAEKKAQDLLSQALDQLKANQEEQASHKLSSPVSKNLIQELHTQIEELRAANSDKDHEMHQLDMELNQKDENIEQLELRLKQNSERSFHDTAAESQLEELKHLMKDRDSKLQQQERQIHLLQQELDHNKSKASKSSHNVQDLQDQLDAMRRKMALLAETLANRSTGERSSQELLGLKDQQLELESEITRLKSAIRESKAIISEQKQVIDDLKESEYALEDMRREREHLNLKVEKIERENRRTHKLYTELKKSSQYTKMPQNKDDLWRSEIELLSNQISDLNMENDKLYKDLEREKGAKSSNADSYAKLEVKSLSAKCNDLQMELSDRDSAIQRLDAQHKRELERYKSTLQDREDELTKMKDEFRSLKISTTQSIDNDKIELLRLKSLKESQVKLMQIELDNLKEQHQVEVDSLKNLIQKLRRSPTNDLYKDTQDDNADRLLQSVSEKNTRIKYLTEKLTNALLNLKELRLVVSQVESKKESLEVDNKKMEHKLDQLTEKLYEYKRLIQRGVDHAVSQDDYDDVRLQLKIKEKELQGIKGVKTEFADKYRLVSDENEQLQRKIDKIVSKYRQLQNSLKTKTDNNSQNQAEYYKMKHTKASYVIKDLRFVNSFMVNSIQATNMHIRGDIKKMQQVGIYPDYELICKKKPTLAALVKFVVAAVRIRRKTHHSATRNQKIELLEMKLS